MTADTGDWAPAPRDQLLLHLLQRHLVTHHTDISSQSCDKLLDNLSCYHLTAPHEIQTPSNRQQEGELGESK